MLCETRRICDYKGPLSQIEFPDQFTEFWFLLACEMLVKCFSTLMHEGREREIEIIKTGRTGKEDSHELWRQILKFRARNGEN
jgi:hypothetical protein